MRLFIAEKPKMGQDIAKALPGPHVRKDGYIETGAGIVTWCIGHILRQAEPQAYDPKYEAFPGSFEVLPIAPQVWKMEVDNDKRKQANTIKALLKQCSEVIHAGDPGREGQLIVDEVLEYFGNRKPVYRILLKALDKVSVTRALNQLQDNTLFFPLYQAALGRQYADYLIGMNCTRGFTILARQQNYWGVLSLGRVQTPTLAIVVRRDLEIEQFKPVPYWSIKAQFTPQTTPEQPFWATWVPPGVSANAALNAASKTGDEDPVDQDDEDEDEAAAAGASGAAGASAGAAPIPRPAWLDEHYRIIDQAKAQSIAQALRQAGQGTVVRNERKAAQEKAPLLYELTGMQSKLNAKTGASVDDVLKACQSLYEKGHTSYPRTDSPYLPLTLFGDMPTILAGIKQTLPHLGALVDGADLTLKSRVWDDDKVGEHYGLVPTMSPPDWASLTALEQAAYEQMALRLLMQFYPVCEVDKALVEIESAGERLVARGRIVRVPGWRVVLTGAPDAGDEETAPKADEGALPNVQNGQTVKTKDVQLQSLVTKPPPRFTQGTLLKAMKHVAKLVTDPAERKLLRAVEGIGRSATRAAIIETLFKREFLAAFPTPKSKQIVSTPVARILVQSCPKPLTDPGLTARWEQALDAVAKQKATLPAFLQKQEQWVTFLVQSIQATVLPPLPPKAAPAAGGSGGARKAPSRSAGSGKPSASKSAAPRPTGPKPASVGAGQTCPACKKGTMQAKTARASGKTFLGCSNWPKCNHTEWP